MVVKSKLQPLAEESVPDAPDTETGSQDWNLGADFLSACCPPQQHAYGPRQAPSKAHVLLNNILAKAGTFEDASDLTREAVTKAHEQWEQSAQRTTVLELEARIKGVEQARVEAERIALQAETDYRAAVSLENEPVALEARKTAREAADAVAFKGDQITELQARLGPLQEASRTEERRLLKLHAAALLDRLEERADKAMALLGEALRLHLPDCQLVELTRQQLRRVV
jgi:hypothetical protein